MRKLPAALFMITALAGVTGCATTSDLDALRSELKADVQKANDTASRAASDAAAARADAAEAKSMAEQANSTAAETSEKLDRAFKKSMYK